MRPASTGFILDSCSAVPAYLCPVTSRLGEAQTVSPTAPFLLRLLGHGGGPVLRHQHRHRFALRSRHLHWDSVSSHFCSARARRHTTSGDTSRPRRSMPCSAAMSRVGHRRALLLRRSTSPSSSRAGPTSGAAPRPCRVAPCSAAVSRSEVGRPFFSTGSRALLLSRHNATIF